MTTMRTLAARTIRAHPTRFVATVLAVLVSTGFLAGALILRDSVTRSIEATVHNQLRGVDAAIQPNTGSARGRGANATSGGPGGERQLGVSQGVPTAVVDQVRATPGVEEAAGVMGAFMSVLDGRGSSVAENVWGSVWIPPDELNPYRIVEGRPPASAGEVALDERTVGEGGFALGARVQLVTPQGPRDATLVGISNYGDVPASSRGDVLVSDADGFEWFAEGRTEYQSVYVAAQDGTDPSSVVSSLRGALGEAFIVETGDVLRQAATGGELGGIITVIGGALIGFSLVAMFVALFTIYNTFSIVVGQRTREFALLRALGASAQQVKRSVRTEAALLGFISSAAGFLLGILAFQLLIRLVPQIREVVGSVTLTISPVSVLIVLACGTLVTVVSAIIPGWRAARARPVEAMREIAIDRSGVSRFRAVTGLVLIGIGVVLLLAGSVSESFWLMLPGPPLLFLGVLIGGPVLASSFGRTVEAGVRRLGNATLDVGVENVRRNPRRSSATALALVIGVFLVVLVTAGGGAVRDYAVTGLAGVGGPDVMVVSGNGAMPQEFVRQVREIDGVSAVAQVYFGTAELGQTGLPVSAVDYRDLPGVGLSFEQGDAASLAPGDLIVPGPIAVQEGIAVGDTVVIGFGNGENRPLRVGALSEMSFPPFAYMSADVARETDPMIVPFMLNVTAEGGQAQNVSDRMTALARNYAGLEVEPGSFFAQTIKNFFNFVIAAVSGMLAVAVVIALFGIVNTLVLSVTERRREIGLLRAVGMTRWQVGTTIRLESIAVSVLGALVGTAFGLFVAWCLTRPILNQDGEVATGFSWPVTQLVAIGILAVVVGVVASIPPARRAARFNIVEAVTVE